MAIKACMNCGSRDLEWKDDVFSGRAMLWGTSTLAGKAKCNKCGSFEVPIEFKDEKGRKAFESKQAERLGQAKKGKKK